MPSPATLVQWLQRGLDIPAQAAAVMAERLSPTLIVGNVSNWWENNSQVVRPASGWYTKAAVAAANSHVALVNPAAAGINCVLTHLGLWSAQFLLYEILTCTEAEVMTLTGIAEGQTLTGFRDTRGIEASLSPASGANRTVAGVWAGVENGLLDGQRLRRIQTYTNGLTAELNERWVLAPGTAIVVVCTTVNKAVDTVVFDWEEHRIAR